MKSMQALPRTGTRPARGTMIGLLAALAITLAGVATPLTGAAHAGGLTGGVVGSRANATEFELSGRKPGVGMGSGGAAQADQSDQDLFGGRGGISGDTGLAR